MNGTPCGGEADLAAMRALLTRLASTAAVVDFEEQMLLAGVRSRLRLGREGGDLVGFAWVDDYCNLWFETAPHAPGLAALEDEIVTWGVECVRKLAEPGEPLSLDAVCRADQTQRAAVLLRHGFVRQAVRTLRYARPLAQPVADCPPPPGFCIRAVTGPQEVDALVALHRAAFDTDNMSVEERLAMMSTPHYRPQLDLVAVAPGGELAAFCVCGLEDGIGSTDPIGTHPRFQRRGLGGAVMTAGLQLLRAAGALSAELGTSSENTAMQRLAEKLGFTCVSEKVWFSKAVE